MSTYIDAPEHKTLQLDSNYLRVLHEVIGNVYISMDYDEQCDVFVGTKSFEMTPERYRTFGNLAVALSDMAENFKNEVTLGA
jgi:hypothetical protein